MNELRSMVEDSVVKLFEDTVDRAFLRDAENDGFPKSLWDTVMELGLDRVLVSDTNGGMDGTWPDAYPVIRACGQFAVPLPIPEAIIAAWVLQSAGLAPRSAIPGLLIQPIKSDAMDGNKLTATIERVPWGRDADYFIGLVTRSNAAASVIIVDAKNVEVLPDLNLNRDARDTVKFKHANIVEQAETPFGADAIRWLAALARSAQIAGAGSACLKLGLEYTSEREQFGRPLARFQAIQHHLAHMAGELATVEAMSAAAFEALDRYGLATNSDHNAKFEIAAAKCRASDAVEPLTKIGHQVHGAIGFTYEYGLHFLTRQLWSWRAEFGGSSEWAQYLGKVAVDAGGDEIWSVITR